MLLFAESGSIHETESAFGDPGIIASEKFLGAEILDCGVLAMHKNKDMKYPEGKINANLVAPHCSLTVCLKLFQKTYLPM